MTIIDPRWKIQQRGQSFQHGWHNYISQAGMKHIRHNSGSGVVPNVYIPFMSTCHAPRGYFAIFSVIAPITQ